MDRTLIFVYNADSSLFGRLSDWAHKIFSPATYPCTLCALTYNHVGMRREWREFIASLELPSAFLHADELKERYGLTDVALPAVLVERASTLDVLISKDALESCATLADLKTLVTAELGAALRQAAS